MEEFSVVQSQQQLHKRDFTFYQNASQHEDINSDSGYNSCQLTPNSFSSFNYSTSSFRQTTSVLATISEDCENGPTHNQLADTPTTASARLIDNFHLTTPNVPNPGFMVNRPKGFQTPTKVDPFGSCFGMVRTPLRTISPNVKAQDANVTPRKGKLSAKRRHSNFRDRLYSDENDCDMSQKRRCLELNDGESLNTECRRLSDISPIMKFGRSKSSEINSLMRSSTPKTAASISLTNQWGLSEQTPTKLLPVKSKFRKFQSFSPSKMCSYKRKPLPPALLLNPPVIPERPKIEHKEILAEVDSVLDGSKTVDDVEMSFDMSDFNLTPAKPNDEPKIEPVLEQVVKVVSPKKVTISAKKKFKRPQSRSSSLRKWERIHKQQKEHKRSYEGFEKLNILKHLENNQPAINIILNYLSDIDLVNVVQVSKNWQRIVESNGKCNKRLKDYLKHNRVLKENQHAIEQKKTIVRQPFSICNILDTTNDRKLKVDISPPVSPSRRKFKQNQKIASHLKKSDTLTTCPRCSSFSKVIKAKRIRHPALVKKSISMNEGRKSVPALFGDNESDLNNSSQMYNAKIRRNLFATVSRAKKRANSVDCVTFTSLVDNSEQKSDYAECSGLQCGFKFCVKCLCEFHPHTICPDFNPASPSKEEERSLDRNIPCTRKSKKSLLRLCK